MISWISYTTATVSADFQGIKTNSFSERTYSKYIFNVTRAYYQPMQGQPDPATSTMLTLESFSYVSGSATPISTIFYRSHSDTRISNKSINNGGQHGTTINNTIRSKNSITYSEKRDGMYPVPVSFTYSGSEIDPKETVSQYTTTTSSSPHGQRKMSTQTAAGGMLVWTTYIVDNSDTTVIMSYKEVTSTVESVYTEPYDETFLTLQTTTEFITWTDLLSHQVVVGHTIWEDSKGFAFFTHGDFKESLKVEELNSFDPNNSDWSPISEATWQTATRTTESYKPYYIKLGSVQVGQDGVSTNEIILTCYGQLGETWATDSNNNAIGQEVVVNTIVKTLLDGYQEKFPFTTTNIPEGWGEDEYGGQNEWGGIPIHKCNTLESVKTSDTVANYLGIQQNYSYLNTVNDSFTSIETSGNTGIEIQPMGGEIPFWGGGAEGVTYSSEYINEGRSEGKTEGEAYIRRDAELTSFIYYPKIFLPDFYSENFGAPNLNFSKSTFSASPLFLELVGNDITINDLFGFGYPAVYNGSWNKLDVPFALPSFTAYAKPTQSGADEQGYTYSGYESEQSDWTTVTVNREGASFSSSWVWNIDSIRKSSNSGTAMLQARHEIPTDIRLYPIHGFVLGGAQFPHATMTIFDHPKAFLMTTYNNNSSGTLSSIEKGYSVITTEQSVGNANLTVFSCLSFVMGHGMMIQPLWDIG